MTDIVDRINNRLHDAPMPTEHLLDEAAEEIEQLREALKLMTEWASNVVETNEDSAEIERCRALANGQSTQARE